ncbi:MAG: carboxypeptidase-like regulatory domain-containing protein [Bacteroidetes bacterium]|nr:carboxypeptidase-like regulatory domain-containing protein [Bacteroidota bacterium]
MRYTIWISFFLTLFMSLGCQKPRKIGGRVIDATTGEPIENAALTIISSAGTGGVVVTTNTSGYYVYKPETAIGDYAIQLANLQGTGPQGAEGLAPFIQYAKESDLNREYDFYIERNKRLNLRFKDTVTSPSKVYNEIFGFIYTKNQNLNGVQKKLIEPNNITENSQVFTLSKLGWNYISGYVSTSENSVEPFFDSIFVQKPLDGMDTLTIYY